MGEISSLYEINSLSYNENKNSVRSRVEKFEVIIGTFYYSSSNITNVD